MFIHDKNGDGSKTSYWKQEKAHAPYLTMMAIGEFAEVKDSWNGIDVNYYVEKRIRKVCAKDIFGNTLRNAVVFLRDIRLSLSMG